jgi:HK97 family phage prohead protease
MTHYSPAISKFLSVPSLGARQIMAVVSDPSLDRTNDVMNPAGCILDNYKLNPIVLAAHNPAHPIGTANVAVRNNRLEALVDFAPAGASPIADQWCNLAKAGIVRAFSVGFDPIEMEPNGKGGFNFNKWELMEVSAVSVPANAGALTIARSHGVKDGRVLSEIHATSLERAHKRIAAGLRDMAGVIEAAGFSPTKGGLLAQEHADALLRAHKRISSARGDVAGVLEAAGREPLDDVDPDEGDEDQELAFLAARLKRARMRGRFDPEADRRRRLIEIAEMRFGPMSSAETAAIERVKLVERMRRTP